MHVAIWIIVALSLGFWSVMAWALHALLSHGSGWFADLVALADRWPQAVWIDAWIPGWRELLHAALDLTRQALGWLGDAAPWAVWALWGMGALFAVGCGALMSLIVALLRPKPDAAAARLR